MTLIQTIHTNRIILQTDKQGICSTEVGALTPVIKKSAKETKPNLLKCKNIVSKATFNVRTLNTINQLPKLRASAAKHYIYACKNIDIITVNQN